MTTGVISIGDRPPRDASQREPRRFRTRLPRIRSLTKSLFESRGQRAQLISTGASSPQEPPHWTGFPSTLSKLSGSQRFRRWFARGRKA